MAKPDAQGKQTMPNGPDELFPTAVQTEPRVSKKKSGKSELTVAVDRQSTLTVMLDYPAELFPVEAVPEAEPEAEPEVVPEAVPASPAAKLVARFKRGKYLHRHPDRPAKRILKPAYLAAAVFPTVIVLLLVLLSLLSPNGGMKEKEASTGGMRLASDMANVQVKKVIAADPSLQGPDSQLPPAEPLGWRFEEGERYFLQADGTRFSGTLTLNGAEVSFDELGRWQSTRLPVPYISQLPDMPSGCEVVSVTMMLNYAGVAVTKEEVAARMPYDDDPNLGFNGSLYDWGDYWYGGVIWPPALLDLVVSFKGSAEDLTGQSWERIQAKIDAGRPVCIWFRADGLDHCVLLTGYGKDWIWLNDPLNEENTSMPLDLFLLFWEQNEYRALSY